MIVGGRDINGLPSVPLPINGDIFFVSAAPRGPGDHSASLPGASPVSVTFQEPSISDAEECQPIINAEGMISCASFECERCLRVIARNSWTTSIACMCGFEAGTGSLDVSFD